MVLRKIFTECCCRYNSNPILIEKLWNEIDTGYSDKKRFYHNLYHLQNLIICLAEVKEQISHWDTILFSVFYHDIVYNPVKQNNEEQSAILAIERLQSIGIGDEIIDNCKEQILATKNHQVHQYADVNIFTDADLSILGTAWDTFYSYIVNIRKDYKIFPDFIYKPGRRKVVQHFLSMEKIYKTDHFFETLEQQAKENLTKELALLS